MGNLLVVWGSTKPTPLADVAATTMRGRESMVLLPIGAGSINRVRMAIEFARASLADDGMAVVSCTELIALDNDSDERTELRRAADLTD